MASFNDPKVSNSILSDVNALRALIRSLATMNPASGNTDMPEGSIQFISTSEGMQFRQYNGSAWSAITSKLMHDVDKVDGYDASKTSTAENIIPVYKTGGLIAGGCEGNAGTASKLKTPVSIDLGGYISGTAVQFDGSKNITLNVNRIDVNNEEDNVLNGIISKAHGGTGRNDGAASDIVLADGGLASEHGQIGSSKNINDTDLDTLVVPGNYFSTNGTLALHYPHIFGESVHVIVSGYGVSKKQAIISENEFWVRDTKNSGGSWTGWKLLSSSRASSYYIYISKSGSDTNSGLDSAYPVLTINQALAIAKNRVPYNSGQSIVFCIGEGDWGDVSFVSLPFIFYITNYSNDASSYSESLPKFTNITFHNSYGYIRNIVVDHIISERGSVVFTDQYIRFSRLSSRNFSFLYISSTSEIKSMDSQVAVFYADLGGEIVFGTRSHKIVENLTLSTAFAVIRGHSFIYFNGSTFSLESNVSVTGKKYEILVSGCTVSSKSYLDSLPGSVAGKLYVGSLVGGIPYGGGSSDSALMADLSWKKVLLQTGGAITGNIQFNRDGVRNLMIEQNDNGFIIGTRPSDGWKSAIIFRNDSYSANPAGFEFCTGTNFAGPSLVLMQNGQAIWNNKNIVRSVNNVNADTNGNVSLNLPYLPLAGGDMTGSIRFHLNNVATGFLATNGDKTGMLFGATGSEGNWRAAAVFRNDSYADNPDGIEFYTGSGLTGPRFLLSKSGQAVWNNKNIVCSVNNTTADTNGNVTISSIGSASILSGCIGGYGGPVTLPNYGTWAYVASTNYRSWGQGSSDGSSYGGVAAGGTTLNFDGRGTGYLIVRIS